LAFQRILSRQCEALYKEHEITHFFVFHIRELIPFCLDDLRLCKVTVWLSSGNRNETRETMRIASDFQMRPTETMQNYLNRLG
jgi:hypothetical protein